MAHEQKFKKLLVKQYVRLYRFDKSKHLLPRFSFAMADLAKLLGVYKQTADMLDM
jgi:hypothetical protein